VLGVNRALLSSQLEQIKVLVLSITTLFNIEFMPESRLPVTTEPGLAGHDMLYAISSFSRFYKVGWIDSESYPAIEL
jgi:hypothetical protein